LSIIFDISQALPLGFNAMSLLIMGILKSYYTKKFDCNLNYIRYTAFLFTFTLDLLIKVTILLLCKQSINNYQFYIAYILLNLILYLPIKNIYEFYNK
jgi:hypothetical protein